MGYRVTENSERIRHEICIAVGARRQVKCTLIPVCIFLQTAAVSLVWGGAIQDMIDNAADGGAVTIGAGTFSETLTVNKNLTIKGSSGTETILQPGAAEQRVITVAAGKSLSLQDLTVTGGQTPSGGVGGGVLLQDGGLTLLRVRITNNSADYGGGVNVNNGLTVTGTQFVENAAGDSGGALTRWNKGYTILISGAVFQNNTSESKGGAALVNSSLNLADSTLSGNMVQSGGQNTSGGGIYTTSPVTVTGCTFTGNQAQCTECTNPMGGGLSIELSPDDLSISTVTDSTFSSNWAWMGGGIFASSGIATISRSVFEDNSAGYGGGLYAHVNGDHLVFQNNSAANLGGGVHGQGDFTNCMFIGNTALGGGGIYARVGDLSLINVLMAANASSSDSWGGAAILAEYVPVSIFNATIARPSRGNGSRSRGSRSLGHPEEYHSGALRHRPGDERRKCYRGSQPVFQQRRQHFHFQWRNRNLRRP